LCFSRVDRFYAEIAAGYAGFRARVANVSVKTAATTNSGLQVLLNAGKNGRQTGQNYAIVPEMHYFLQKKHDF